jgi:DNA primase
MDANEVKDILTTQNIVDLLEDLGGSPIQRGGLYYSRTICHHGDSHKLIYYPNDKNFHCYSGCSCSYDIFSLVEKTMSMDFTEAFRFICMKFGINYRGKRNYANAVDSSFFNRFERKEETYELRKLSKTILRTYHELYHRAWVNDGISARSMAKYNIHFSILDNQIIIPHYDIDNNLVGVRARNMDEELVSKGMKYFPVRYKGEILRHPTGAVLYGLNFNRKHIEKYRTVVLFEAEKSVMQLDTIWPDMSIGVCVSGSALSNAQVEILKSLNVENVIIAPDKEYTEIGSEEEQFYKKKIRSTFLNKLDAYFNCSIMWDTEGLLGEKMSPSDAGKEVFERLWETKQSSLILTH